MTTPFDHGPPPDFVSDYLDGVATPGQLDALAHWLRASPDNVAAFAAAAYLDRLVDSSLRHQEEIKLNLRTHLQRQAGSDLELLELMKQLEPRQPVAVVDATQDMIAQDLEAQRAQEAAEAARAEKDRPWGAPVKRTIVIPRSVAYLATAAVLALVFWVGHFVFFTGEDPAPGAHIPLQPQPVFVAEIIQTAGDFVGPSNDNPADSRMLAMGKPVVFESGYAQVLFDSGTNLYIQGPAIIEPTGPAGVRLSTGRLTADVPSSASAFSVACGQAVITADPTDPGGLTSPAEGAELGIAAENRSVEVYAYTGRVRLDSTDASHHGQEIVAGEAVGITEEGLSAIEPDEHTRLVRSDAFAFYAECSARLAYLAGKDGDAYLQAVSRLRPSAWWRFEPDGPILGRPLGDYEVATDPTRNGHHLELKGRGAIEAGDIFPFTGSESFSMACWIRPEQTSHHFLFGRMDHSPEGAYRGYDLFLYGGHVLFQAKNEYYSLDPNQNNLIRVRSNEPVATGEWVHIIATYDGSRRALGTQLYINGVQQHPEVLNDSLTGTIQTHAPFRIGVRGALAADNIIDPHRSGDLASYRHYGKPYAGGIDEVMVFDYALSEEAAYTLYRESMPQYQLTFHR